ncbi:UDP-glucuronosyltransferase 2A1-like [Oncorhynchus tshawytscha]|uniref:UDP-glucuronosyltransferase n=1 Tax=Oncorhynchus tshawytscha TaxID=74940 RepID=A0A8C8MID2_ONCTS|nr:UDP-glucuronosyltransferase 2A1-like [Oncorhynchus tshawytscha]XP_042161187.1 UDP-glucuronosyltransferase 2A1-like [Oncorhynchus tshawytscha]XP_042161188.1 UDP-glucuronosyltransferase 2A1-like [Oncorhynchus tshawytscha]
MSGLNGVTGFVLAVSVAFLGGPPGALGGNILIFPLDGSHWVNMNLLIEGLHARGHQVTVVRSASSWYIKESSPHYRSISITVPGGMDIEKQDFFASFLVKMLQIQREGASPLAFVSFYSYMLSALSGMHQQASQFVVEMFENKALMQSLRDSQYDVVLLDPGLPVGVLVAHKLGLPTVFNVRWITSGEGHFVVAPSPMSYVPTAGYASSDKMTFCQRVGNVFIYLLNMIIDMFVISPHYDRLVKNYFEPGTNFYHLLQGTDLWLMRVDFVFEFPRPTMPNIVYIGGFQCKPSKPLPTELEEFVQSSGEHGVILMSLGTLVKGLPVEITSEIAAAFAQLPQKVIWRHMGKQPIGLGNNTLLVNWMPQNDLLGHPKVKAFVAHGGTNGLYEAMYHGVPVVGLPLLFDQFENVLRLEVRGAAKVLEVTKISSQSFLEAVQEVLHNPSYRTSMERLSSLHRDKPMHPLDTALFWIEFVMRHKGAAHLRTESYKMPWYSYHSLDVIGFLLAVLFVLVAITVGSIYFLCLRLCRKRKPKQE